MNSKYRIGFLCAGAAFFLFITLAYKMTYDYTMDKYMEKVSERNEDVQKADGIGKTESIATEGEAVKGGAKKGFYLKELTEIPLSDLPEEVRQEIAQGKQIATAEELYAFLENYSS